VYLFSVVRVDSVQSTKILKIQKRILCLMKSVNSRTSCTPIFIELKILTVISLYSFEALYYLWKHNLYSTKNSDFCEYNNRREAASHVPNCNTSTYKKTVISTSNCMIDYPEIKKMRRN
jgi:hypothetical protein